MQNEHENAKDKRFQEIMANGPETAEKLPKKSQADRLIELINEENCILFHDQFSEPYAHLLIKDHWENWRLKSKQFKRWLYLRMWEAEGKAPHTNAIMSAISTLEGTACFHGQTFMLENRVANYQGAIWYDLTNEKWQAIKITREGWEVIDNPPILFKRYNHQQPQVMPSRNGNVNKIEQFVNLAGAADQVLLLIIYLVTCFIPGIPHPIPILYGPQGAAKSTLARMLRALIDPSSFGVLSLPNNNTELVQQLYHHWFAFFDNISYLPESASDTLCRAVTGEGFSKRELYSDDDDVIYSFQRCIGLNGINIAAKKPDLLDRGILFKLNRIADDRRKSEKDVLSGFESERPIILGGIFDLLSKAMVVRDNVQLKQLPRMADFALWGYSVSQVLVGNGEDFLNSYKANIGDQHDEVIQENPVAMAIMSFMEEEDSWKGSPSDLFEVLGPVAEKEKLNNKGGNWPKSVSVLSRRINEVKTNLAGKGILVESEKVGNGKRQIMIEKVTKNVDVPATNVESIERAQEIFGGEILDESQIVPKIVPPLNESAISQNTVCGACGDDSGLPF